MTEALGVLARWALFGGLTAMIGSCVGARILADPQALEPRRRLAARTGSAASALILAALAILFALQLAEFRDPFAPLRDDAALLLASSWGRAWSLGMAGATLALIAFTFVSARPTSRSSRLGWAIASLTSVGLAAQPAFTGHAQAGPQPWAWMADALHVLGAGLWIGALPIVVWAALRPADAGAPTEAPLGAEPGALAATPTAAPTAGNIGPGEPTAHHILHRFTPWALAGASMLALTGSFGAWIHLGSLPALVSTSYGRLLLAKLLIVGAIVTLGAVNWRRNVGRLTHGDAQPLRRAALLEWGLAQLAIAVTAVLVHTPPPGQ